MKTRTYLLLLLLLCSSLGFSQSRKSVSILGDSYSTYAEFIPTGNAAWYPRDVTDVVSVTQTWWHKFIKENGYLLCMNDSYSGATICNTGYDKNDYTDRSFVTRMNHLGCPDIIFIFGGTNDSWANVPMGEFKYEGWTKDDLFKFCPAMTYMFDHMVNCYPNVELYFILNTGLKEECNEAVRTACKHYKIGLIELRDIDKKSGHPSIKGMEQINEQVKNFIAKKKR